jgi:hypothetical protein
LNSPRPLKKFFIKLFIVMKLFVKRGNNREEKIKERREKE